MLDISTSQRDLLESLVSLGFLQSVDRGLDSTHNCNRNLEIPKIVNAIICVGLYPQIGKIIRPAQRFVDTQGGKIEKEVLALELEFMILDNSGSGSGDDDVGIVDRDKSSSQKNNNSNNNNISNSANSSSKDNSNNNNGNNNNNNNSDNKIESMSSNSNTNNNSLIKVLIDPSSLNAKNNTFKSSNYIVYSEKKLRAQQGANRDNLTAYIHDVSEVSPFPLLLFCGELSAEYMNSIVRVDKWIEFSAPGKLVVLILQLRKAFDRLLSEKILDPTFEISDSRVLQVVCSLLATDGLNA